VRSVRSQTGAEAGVDVGRKVGSVAATCNKRCRDTPMIGAKGARRS
jgi:hypothetical protein